MSNQEKKFKSRLAKPFVWFKGLKKSRKVLLFIVLAAVVFGATRMLGGGGEEMPPMDEFAMSYPEIPVDRGEVKKTIYVTGHALADQEQVVSGVADEVVRKVNFKEGDSVKKGDIIYELDDTEARLNYQLQLLQYEKMVSESAGQSSGSNKIVSGASGEIKEMNIGAGSEVTQDSVVAVIENKEYVEVRNALRVSDYSLFSEGETVQVFFPQFITFLDGTIVRLDEVGTPTTGGGMVHYVTIRVKNGGSLTEGMKAKLQTEKGGRTITATESGLTYFADDIEVRLVLGEPSPRLKWPWEIWSVPRRF